MGSVPQAWKYANIVIIYKKGYRTDCGKYRGISLLSFLSQQSDFSARLRFCSSLQASLYAAVVDLVLLVCNTLWWAWPPLFIRVCSSWSLGSNQYWCFLSGLPRYVVAVLYTTCYRAAYSSSVPYYKSMFTLKPVQKQNDDEVFAIVAIVRVCK